MAVTSNNENVTVVEAEGGVFKLGVARAEVARIEVVDVDFMLFLKKGARIVLVNAAMDAMSDHPPVILFADGSRMSLASLLDEVGKINIGDNSLPALSSFLPFDKSDSDKQLKDANSSTDQQDTEQQDQLQQMQKPVQEGLAPTNSGGVTDAIQQMIQNGVPADNSQVFPDPPNPNVIVVIPAPPSIFSPPSSSTPPTLFAPVLLVDIFNVVQQGKSGNIIYGGGGDSTTAGNSSPGAQMMAETISGSAGNDVIYPDYYVDPANNPAPAGNPGFAKIFHFQVAGYITSVNTLTVQNVPAGWAIAGATDLGGGTWALSLTGLVTTNGFDVKLTYASYEADPLNPVHTGPVDVRFTVNVTDTTGTSSNISRTLHLAVADAVYPSDLSYVDGAGQTVTVLPAQGNPDYVLAGAGDDTVYAGLGNDTVLGETGNDTLSGGSGADYLDGGSGANWAYFNDASATTGVTVNLATGHGYGGFAQGDTYLNIQNVLGSAFDDVLIGNPNNNSLLGNAGNDTLIGGAGNNYLDGGAGADTADYSSATAALTIALDGSGNAASVINGQGGTDQLTSIENLIGGSAGDVFTGNAADNILQGSGGNDTLDGGAGADVLDGGIGSNWASYQSSIAGISADLGTPANNSGDAVGDNYINIQNLLGSNQGDTLAGDANVNILDGAGGNDILYGNGNDTLIGGAGADSLVGQVATVNWASYQTSATGVVANLGNAASNTGDAAGDTYTNIQNLLGSNFDDMLYGDAADNTIIGGAGNDTLDGGGGTDVLDGGSGTADMVSFASLAAGPGVTLDSGGGANVIATLGANTATLMNIEIFEGSTFDDAMTGGSGNDTFYGLNGNDTLDGGYGSNYLDGGAGTDTVTFASLGTNGVTITINADGSASAVASNLAGNGTDTSTLVNIENIIGSAGNDVITGSAADNVFSGGGGNDTLYGGAGNDTLSGDTGNDILYGEAGNDTLNGGAGNNTLDGGAGADVLNGGGGLGDVNWAGYQSATSGVVADLTNSANNNVTVNDAAGDSYSAIQNLLGSNFDDTLTGDAGDNIIAGAGGNDTIFGMAGVDTLYGDAGADTLFGGNNDDTLSGGAGNDSLDGGSGNDTLDGGAGADILNGGVDLPGEVNWAGYQSSNMGVIADLGNAASNTGDAAGDTYTNIQNLLGSNFNDTLTGDVLVNTIDGSGGNDTLYGGDGNDILLGGAGNDVLDGGNGNDYIDGGAGIDKVSFLTSGVGVNITVDPLDPTTAIATDGTYTDTIVNVEIVEGSNYNDILSGTNVSNTLLGGAGNDTLDGGGGNDTLDGGAGTDIVSFASYATPVVINVTGGYSIASVGGDTLTLIGIEEITGGTGNDTITGDASNNIFSGGNGNDTLVGGLGSDTVHGDAGNDLIFGDGQSTANTTSPSDAVDTLYGDAGNDTIYGGGGDDFLEGGIGADKLYGGAGSNWAGYINSSAVTINLGTSTATGGEATGDILNNIQNLIGGSGNDTLTGDGSINILQGGAGGDTLAGGLGNDTLDGGLGIDTADYRSAGGSVTVNLAANASYGTAAGADGNDTLYGIENVLGSGFADIITGEANGNALSGNGGNDTLYAGAGASTLDGGSGDDTLIGGTGNDTLLGGAGNDYLDGGDGVNYLDGGTGIDTVNFLGISGGVSGTAGVVITGNPDGTATATIELASGSLATEVMQNIEIIIGSNNADFITGTAGDNTLYGKDGNDTLIGGLGNDSIYGGDVSTDTGNDTVSYINAAGSVTVNLAANASYGTATGADGNDQLYGIENVLGSGYADILTGDSNINAIDGGDGSDTIDGGANNDTLFGGNGNDTLAGGLGNDTLHGGDAVTDTGNDTANYTSSVSALVITLDASGNTANVSDGLGGVDQLYGIENLIGGSNNDTLVGNASANILTGGLGNDMLYGMDGADTLYGGSGNDTLYGGPGINLIDGGAGIDTADYSAETAAISVTLRGVVDGSVAGTGITDTLRGIENVIGGSANDTIVADINANFIDGAGGTDTASYSNSSAGVRATLNGASNSIAGVGGDAAGDVLVNIENLIGSAYNDTLTGDSAINIIDGGTGNDILNAGLGDDTLAGGAGNDTLVGGAGINLLDGGADIDTADYGLETAALSVTLLGAADGNAAAAGATFSDTLRGIENVIGGSGNDMIVADINANFINGNVGTDTVSYANSGAGVIVTLNGASNSIAGVGGDATGDILANIEKLIGSIYNDTLTGDSGINILDGGAGNDTLAGGIGNDTLLGGDGDDILIGGDGVNVLSGGNGSDTADYSAQAVAFNVNFFTGVASSGTGITDSLISIENVIGGSANDVFVVNSSANVIDGRGGIDAVSYGNDTTGVVAYLDGTPGAGGLAAGDALFNIEFLIGGSGQDTFTGNSGNNTLVGNGGDDILYGAGGTDSLSGGAGADTFIVAAANLTTNTINGGADASIDILQINGLAAGSTLALSSFDANITSIEKLDIRDGVNSNLALGLADIRAMVDNGNTSNLTIRMDSGDTLSFNGVGDTVSSAFDPTFATTHYTFTNGALAATLDLVTV